MGVYNGVPIALVLLFTQLRSEMTNFNKGRARKTLKAFEAGLAVLDGIIEHADDKQDGYANLAHDRFILVMQAFRDAFDEGQPPLL